MKHSLVSHNLHLNNIVSKTLSHRDPIPTTNHGGCDSLNVNCAPWACVYKHMVPTWLSYFGRLWNPWDKTPSWRMKATRSRLWDPTLPLLLILSLRPGQQPCDGTTSPEHFRLQALSAWWTLPFKLCVTVNLSSTKLSLSHSLTECSEN